MRLLFCKECTDIKALTVNRRHCSCRKSYGRELASGNVRVAGPAAVLGLPRDEVEIMRGPAVDSPEYVLHKLIVLAPILGRKPATTIEFVG